MGNLLQSMTDADSTIPKAITAPAPAQNNNGNLSDSTTALVKKRLAGNFHSGNGVNAILSEPAEKENLNIMLRVHALAGNRLNFRAKRGEFLGLRNDGYNANNKNNMEPSCSHKIDSRTYSRGRFYIPNYPIIDDNTFSVVNKDRVAQRKRKPINK